MPVSTDVLFQGFVIQLQSNHPSDQCSVVQHFEDGIFRDNYRVNSDRESTGTSPEFRFGIKE